MKLKYFNFHTTLLIIVALNTLITISIANRLLLNIEFSSQTNNFQTTFLLNKSEVIPSSNLNSKLYITRSIPGTCMSLFELIDNTTLVYLTLKPSNTTKISNCLLELNENISVNILINLNKRKPKDNHISLEIDINDTNQVKFNTEYIFRLFNDSSYGLIKDDMTLNGIVSIVRLLYPKNDTIDLRISPQNKYFQVKKFLKNFYMIRLASNTKEMFEQFDTIEFGIEAVLNESNISILKSVLKFKIVRANDLKIKFSEQDLNGINLSIAENYGTQPQTYGGIYLTQLESYLTRSIFLNQNSTDLLNLYSKNFIRFSIVNSNLNESMFELDSTSGHLNIASNQILDREYLALKFKTDKVKIWLNMSVYDTNKLFKPNYITVNINVLDLNDNYPIFAKDKFSLEINSNKIDEAYQSIYLNNRKYFLIFNESAIDFDSGENSTLDYALLSVKLFDKYSNIADFYLEKTNGRLWIPVSLLENDIDGLVKLYFIQIVCKDNGRPSFKHSTVTLNLRILSSPRSIYIGNLGEKDQNLFKPRFINPFTRNQIFYKRIKQHQTTSFITNIKAIYSGSSDQNLKIKYSIAENRTIQNTSCKGLVNLSLSLDKHSGEFSVFLSNDEFSSLAINRCFYEFEVKVIASNYLEESTKFRVFIEILFESNFINRHSQIQDNAVLEPVWIYQNLGYSMSYLKLEKCFINNIEAKNNDFYLNIQNGLFYFYNRRTPKNRGSDSFQIECQISEIDFENQETLTYVLKIQFDEQPALEDLAETKLYVEINRSTVMLSNNFVTKIDHLSYIESNLKNHLMSVYQLSESNFKFIKECFKLHALTGVLTTRFNQTNLVEVLSRINVFNVKIEMLIYDMNYSNKLVKMFEITLYVNLVETNLKYESELDSILTGFNGAFFNTTVYFLNQTSDLVVAKLGFKRFNQDLNELDFELGQINEIRLEDSNDRFHANKRLFSIIESQNQQFLIFNSIYLKSSELNYNFKMYLIELKACLKLFSTNQSNSFIKDCDTIRFNFRINFELSLNQLHFSADSFYFNYLSIDDKYFRQNLESIEPTRALIDLKSLVRGANFFKLNQIPEIKFKTINQQSSELSSFNRSSLFYLDELNGLIYLRDFDNLKKLNGNLNFEIILENSDLFQSKTFLNIQFLKIETNFKEKIFIESGKNVEKFNLIKIDLFNKIELETYEKLDIGLKCVNLEPKLISQILKFNRITNFITLDTNSAKNKFINHLKLELTFSKNKTELIEFNFEIDLIFQNNEFKSNLIDSDIVQFINTTKQKHRIFITSKSKLDNDSYLDVVRVKNMITNNQVLALDYRIIIDDLSNYFIEFSDILSLELNQLYSFDLSVLKRKNFIDQNQYLQTSLYLVRFNPYSSKSCPIKIVKKYFNLAGLRTFRVNLTQIEQEIETVETSFIQKTFIISKIESTRNRINLIKYGKIENDMFMFDLSQCQLENEPNIEISVIKFLIDKVSLQIVKIVEFQIIAETFDWKIKKPLVKLTQYSNKIKLYKSDLISTNSAQSRKLGYDVLVHDFNTGLNENDQNLIEFSIDYQDQNDLPFEINKYSGQLYYLISEDTSEFDSNYEKKFIFRIILKDLNNIVSFCEIDFCLINNDPIVYTENLTNKFLVDKYLSSNKLIGQIDLINSLEANNHQDSSQLIIFLNLNQVELNFKIEYSNDVFYLDPRTGHLFTNDLIGSQRSQFYSLNVKVTGKIPNLNKNLLFEINVYIIARDSIDPSVLYSAGLVNFEEKTQSFKVNGARNISFNLKAISSNINKEKHLRFKILYKSTDECEINWFNGNILCLFGHKQRELIRLTALVYDIEDKYFKNTDSSQIDILVQNQKFPQSDFKLHKPDVHLENTQIYVLKHEISQSLKIGDLILNVYDLINRKYHWKFESDEYRVFLINNDDSKKITFNFDLNSLNGDLTLKNNLITAGSNLKQYLKLVTIENSQIRTILIFKFEINILKVSNIDRNELSKIKKPIIRFAFDENSNLTDEFPIEINFPIDQLKLQFDLIGKESLRLFQFKSHDEDTGLNLETSYVLSTTSSDMFHINHDGWISVKKVSLFRSPLGYQHRLRIFAKDRSLSSLKSNIIDLRINTIESMIKPIIDLHISLNTAPGTKLVDLRQYFIDDYKFLILSEFNDIFEDSCGTCLHFNRSDGSIYLSELLKPIRLNKVYKFDLKYVSSESDFSLTRILVKFYDLNDEKVLKQDNSIDLFILGDSTENTVIFESKFNKKIKNFTSEFKSLFCLDSTSTKLVLAQNLTSLTTSIVNSIQVELFQNNYENSIKLIIYIIENLIANAKFIKSNFFFNYEAKIFCLKQFSSIGYLDVEIVDQEFNIEQLNKFIQVETLILSDLDSKRDVSELFKLVMNNNKRIELLINNDKILQNERDFYNLKIACKIKNSSKMIKTSVLVKLKNFDELKFTSNLAYNFKDSYNSVLRTNIHSSRDFYSVNLYDSINFKKNQNINIKVFILNSQKSVIEDFYLNSDNGVLALNFCRNLTKQSFRIKFELVLHSTSIQFIKKIILNLFILNNFQSKNEIYFTENFIRTDLKQNSQIDLKRFLYQPETNQVVQSLLTTGLKLRLEDDNQFEIDMLNGEISLKRELLSSVLFLNFTSLVNVSACKPFESQCDSILLLIRVINTQSKQIDNLRNYHSNLNSTINLDLNFKDFNNNLIKLNHFGDLTTKFSLYKPSLNLIDIDKSTGWVYLNAKSFDIFKLEKIYFLIIYNNSVLMEFNVKIIKKMIEIKPRNDLEIELNFISDSINRNNGLNVSNLIANLAPVGSNKNFNCDLWKYLNKSMDYFKLSSNCDLFINQAQLTHSSEVKFQIRAFDSMLRYKSLFYNVKLNLRSTKSNTETENKQFYLEFKLNSILDRSKQLEEFYKFLRVKLDCYLLGSTRINLENEQKVEVFLIKSSKFEKNYLNRNKSSLFNLIEKTFDLKIFNVYSTKNIKSPYRLLNNRTQNKSFLTLFKPILNTNEMIVIAPENIQIVHNESIEFSKISSLNFNNINLTIENFIRFKFSFKLNQNITRGKNLIFYSVIKTNANTMSYLSFGVFENNKIELRHNFTLFDDKLALNHTIISKKWYELELQITEKDFLAELKEWSCGGWLDLIQNKTVILNDIQNRTELVVKNIFVPGLDDFQIADFKLNHYDLLDGSIDNNNRINSETEFERRDENSKFLAKEFSLTLEYISNLNKTAENLTEIVLVKSKTSLLMINLLSSQIEFHFENELRAWIDVGDSNEGKKFNELNITISPGLIQMDLNGNMEKNFEFQESSSLGYDLFTSSIINLHSNFKLNENFLCVKKLIINDNNHNSKTYPRKNVNSTCESFLDQFKPSEDLESFGLTRTNLLLINPSPLIVTIIVSIMISLFAITSIILSIFLRRKNKKLSLKNDPNQLNSESNINFADSKFNSRNQLEISLNSSTENSPALSASSSISALTASHSLSRHTVQSLINNSVNKQELYLNCSTLKFDRFQGNYLEYDTDVSKSSNHDNYFIRNLKNNQSNSNKFLHETDLSSMFNANDFQQLKNLLNWVPTFNQFSNVINEFEKFQPQEQNYLNDNLASNPFLSSANFYDQYDKQTFV